MREIVTIVCSGVNKNGLGRHRTRADDPEKQVCYFNEPRNYQVYNVFKSERTKSGNFEKSIYFKIDQVKSKTDSKIFSAKQKLKRNGSGNDWLSEWDRSTDNLFGRGSGNAEDAKQLYKQPRPRQSAQPKVLRGW